MERPGLTIPTESLNTVIIVSTASATGLIVLLVLNLFVCGCIVAMCLKQRNEPTYQRCTPTSVPSVPSIRAPVRVQFQEEANYSEIAPRTEDMFQMRLIQNHRITMSQPHLMTTSFGPHGLHSEHVAMSQPHLSTRQWISQRTTSFGNIYSSVVDSQEDLTEEHIHQVHACIHVQCLLIQASSKSL